MQEPALFKDFFADLLLYSLCPPVSLSVLYEQLLQLLCQDLQSKSWSTSVANACLQLLTSITDANQVLEHRVRRVHRMVLKGTRAQGTKLAERRLCMLLKKYKDLKPQLVPWVHFLFVLNMRSSLSYRAFP